MRLIMNCQHLIIIIINKIRIKNHIFLLFSLMAFFTVFVLSNAGCGKKAPPLPPLQYTLKSPSNLNYLLSRDRNIVTLKWDYNSKNGEHTGCRGFKIFRAERDLSENGCRGCPLKFNEVGSVSSSQFDYTEKIEKGFGYYYKVRAYSDDNDLSPDSNTIKFRSK